MAASYPGSVKVFTTKNTADTIQAAHINDLQDEVNAIEAGLINGTAPLNSSNSTVVHLSATAGLNVVGNSTFGSSITLGTLPYVFPASGASTGTVLAITSTSGSTMTLSWIAQASAGSMTLLKQGSGTNTAAGATTVDSIALSGLTAKDTIVVFYTVESVTQDTALAHLYNVTDAVRLSDFVAGAVVTAGATFIGQSTIGQRQGSSTSVASQATGVNTATAAAAVDGRRTSYATAWTGSWTLGLRHNGVTAGGTFSYVWSVYKVAGQ